MVLPIIIAFLSAVSLISLKSIAPDLVNRQLLFFLVSSVVAYLLGKTYFTHWQTLAKILFWGLNLVLLILLMFGQATRGTVGWIKIFDFFWIQPSQYAVSIVSLFVAFKLPSLETKKIKDLIKLLIWLGLPGLLILVEPDIGTALVYFASLSIVLLLVKIPYKYWLAMIGLGLLGLFLLVSLGLNEQRLQRITSFTSGYEEEVNEEQTAASYNAQQAMIAIGSGRVFGRGLGFGVQSHLQFLPERHTDFIFASIAEEWGFVGAGLLVLVYAGLCLYLLWLSGQVKSQPAQVFILVQTMLLIVQLAINIGMNLGLMPITGITLPLISYGGSSITAVMLGFGLVMSAENEVKKMKVKEIN